MVSSIGEKTKQNKKPKVFLSLLTNRVKRMFDLDMSKKEQQPRQERKRTITREPALSGLKDIFFYHLKKKYNYLEKKVVSLILLSYSCVLVYYWMVNVACLRYSRFQLLFSARLERDSVISDAACTPLGIASYFLCVRDEEIKFLSSCR